MANWLADSEDYARRQENLETDAQRELFAAMMFYAAILEEEGPFDSRTAEALADVVLLLNPKAKGTAVHFAEPGNWRVIVTTETDRTVFAAPTISEVSAWFDRWAAQHRPSDIKSVMIEPT